MNENASAAAASKSGGADRVSFFDEQAQRRRQARAWGFVTTLVAWLLGWVLGFLVLAAIVFYTLLLRSFLPRPWAAALNALASNGAATWLPLSIGGLFFAFGLWAAVRIIFGRDTSAAFLSRLNARAPNPLDPEERQLVNVAEEMAIAATTSVPRVKLFDGDVINAAVLGADSEHVTFLISRRLLNVLDRDETQGVLGHLMASAVNGDLQLTAAMLRVFYVLGLAVTILDLPFSGRARGALKELAHFVFRSKNAPQNSDAEAVAAGLTESLQPEGLQALINFMQKRLEPAGDNGFKKLVGALMLMPLLPLIMIRLGAAMIYGLLSLFVLGPLVAGVLRSRRRLADATAVQLTRNPDGLACALVHLVHEAQMIPGAGWAEMLFIVGPEAASARRLDRFQQRMRSIRESGPDWKSRAQAAAAASRDFSVSAEPDTVAKKHNFIFGFHPSLNCRIAQLKRMGATKVVWEVRADYSSWIVVGIVFLAVGFIALLAFASSRH